MKFFKEMKKWTHLHTYSSQHNSLYYEKEKLHLNFPYYMVQALHNRCQMSRISSKVVCYIILVCKKDALGPSYRPYNNAKISMTFSKENTYKTLLS
jgi:hypothetical protein